ncbi:peptidylprolyl isomerase [Desulfuromonas sp. AOP6]|uniref:FKBP-type peptidyl-prolyl cis-trans isomerase n=1 Tax=Desulfuromonas sp. AOP6 TaxID=1566351 RepID=UPI0012787817|nr:peptidylprolyl isomerase [Desulfuromonas sp. AOP6]BCA79896.1 peptidyl-prolyl cis-trans isomerase [Desulfuromonas sp. AOP6]
MAKAKKGDNVSIDFIGKLNDGTIFDTTFDDGQCEEDHCESGPMELTLGEGEFFQEIEEALIGMSPGDKKVVKIPAESAFGEYDDDKVFTVSRDKIPGDFVPEVGQELEMTTEDDEVEIVTVVEFTEDSVTFDANHPLIGEDLTYEIELVEIL